MRITVRRCGGFTGRADTVTVEAASLEPAERECLLQLVSAARLPELPGELGAPCGPDRYVYDVHCDLGPDAHRVRVHEGHVPTTLARLIALAFDLGRRE